MSGRKNAGRGSGKRKEGYLQVRVDAHEKEGFEAAAELSGLSLSTWVRERLRREARKELEEANLPIPFLPKPPTGSAAND